MLVVAQVKTPPFVIEIAAIGAVIFCVMDCVAVAVHPLGAVTVKM
jgi:hypothetical protein